MEDLQQVMKIMKQLASADKVKHFLEHPKVRDLLQDPQFQQIAAKKDFMKLLSHPKFNDLMKDPEIQKLSEEISQK